MENEGGDGSQAGGCSGLDTGRKKQPLTHSLNKRSLPLPLGQGPTLSETPSVLEGPSVGQRQALLQCPVQASFAYSHLRAFAAAGPSSHNAISSCPTIPSKLGPNVPSSSKSPLTAGLGTKRKPQFVERERKDENRDSRWSPGASRAAQAEFLPTNYTKPHVCQGQNPASETPTTVGNQHPCATLLSPPSRTHEAVALPSFCSPLILKPRRTNAYICRLIQIPHPTAIIAPFHRCGN